MPEPHFEDLLEAIKQLAQQAGKEVLAIYYSGNYERYTKEDASPVTTADYLANDIVIAGLRKLTPDIPIISEELPQKELINRQQWDRYWLIDPIDGTQEFISRSGEFAVNIALVEEGWPTLGVIYWPVKETFYFAFKNYGAFKEKSGITKPICVSEYDINTKIKIAISRVQKRELITQYFISDIKAEFIKLGSCSLKNCYVAEGKVDCYLRVGPTGEWDTGASQIIIDEAGGQIMDSEFNALSYNQRETLMNPDFMTLGSTGRNWQQLIKPHTTSRKL